MGHNEELFALHTGDGHISTMLSKGPRGVVWCVWCGMVCGVVWGRGGAGRGGAGWCGVPKALLPEGNGRDVYPRVQVNGRAVCLSVRCVLMCCCTGGTSAQLHWASAALPTPVHGHTGSIGLTALCVLYWTISILCAVLHCLGAVHCTALHCTVCAVLHCTVCAIKANQQHTASAPRGSGQWNFRNAPPHCL